MLATPHLLTGAAIASVAPFPLALPLSFASHFILDAIPHWQETLKPYKPNFWTWVRLPVDLILGVGIFLWLITLKGESVNLLFGALFAILPDLDSIFYIGTLRRFLQRPLFKPWFKFHEGIQRETKEWWGLLPQIAVVLLSLFIILN